MEECKFTKRERKRDKQKSATGHTYGTSKHIRKTAMNMQRGQTRIFAGIPISLASK